MRVKLFAIALASLVILTACIDEKKFVQASIPKQEDATARTFIWLVRDGNYDLAETMLAPSLKNSRASAALLKIHDLLNQGEPVEFVTIGYQFTILRTFSRETKKTDLSYQIQFRRGWVVSKIVLEEEGGASQVLGFQFYPVRNSLEVLNRFSSVGKTPLHYVVLACCVLIPLFIFYALMICIRTPLKRKWLWIIFIVFGALEFRFDWTRGLYEFKPISILLFGVGVVRSSLYAPWVFELGFPVGALVFLLLRRKLIQSSAPKS